MNINGTIHVGGEAIILDGLSMANPALICVLGSLNPETDSARVTVRASIENPSERLGEFLDYLRRECEARRSGGFDGAQIEALRLPLQGLAFSREAKIFFELYSLVTVADLASLSEAEFLEAVGIDDDPIGEEGRRAVLAEVNEALTSFNLRLGLGVEINDARHLFK